MWTLMTAIAMAAGATASVIAQEPEPATRQAAIEQAEAEKAKTLYPFTPGKVERLFNQADSILTAGTVRWHPYLSNAYSGGGFTLGVGYAHFVNAFNFIDFRGSYSVKNYKRIEAEFVAPRLFTRRGQLSVLGGWREATEVAFYGLGTSSVKDDRANYAFKQPYASATLSLRPTRRLLVLSGGVEVSQWTQEPASGSFPSVEEVYTPETLPGLGAKVNYVHTEGLVGLDWRTSAGYTRRGGFYNVKLQDYADNDSEFGFRQVDYEVIQHFPILREAWVISLRGRAQTTYTDDNQQVPFFMLPYVGSGGTLRGFSSRRFRDRNSLLLQAEWRIMANRYLDTAVFYDAGKVTARRSDLDFNHLKSDYGFGVRLHGPFATPLRVELARSNEGWVLVLAGSPVF
jgi:hypothetical protein